MSGQRTLDDFFTKTAQGNKMDTKNRIRKRPSVGDTFHLPLKTVKDDNVIDLTIDDEDNGSILQSESVKLSQTPMSDDSEATIDYLDITDSAPDTPLTLTPETIKMEIDISPEIKSTPETLDTQNIGTPSPPKILPLETIKTEDISPGSAKSSTSSSNSCKVYATPSKSPSIHSIKTPSSRNKFYSPNKKRMVFQRSDNVKRDLNMAMNLTQPKNNCTNVTNGDNVFSEACQGMDDKTIFLLTIINKCKSDPLLWKLMDSESQQLLSSCFHIVKPGMRLVNKLYWRKEGWYKKDEVNNICSEDKKEKKVLVEVAFEAMIESLEKNKFIYKGDGKNMNFSDFERVLGRDDYVQICKILKINNISSKKDAIEELQKFSKRKSNISNYLKGYRSDNSSRVLKMMAEKAGVSYKLSDFARRTLYKLYILMYLGMDYAVIREKRLEFLLLYDKIKRETYPVDKDVVVDNASVVFKTREEFDKYVTAHDIYEEFLTETEVLTKCATVKQVFTLYKSITDDEMERYKSLPLWLRRYTPAYKYVRLLEAGIQDLKKDKEGGHNLLALEILKNLTSQCYFRQHKKAEWYAERALILHNLDRFDEAAELLIEGFNNSLVTDDAKDCMRPRARKIALQKNKPISAELRDTLLRLADTRKVAERQFEGKHIYKQPLERSEQRGKIKFETRTAEGRTVQEAEEYCIGHYLSSGDFTDGEHWEGRIVTSIFFLLFWEIIYTPPEGVRGVFLSPYQKFPLDLFCESFYENRKKAIDDKLRFIEQATEEKFVNMMQDTWNNRPETELSGITRNIGWENIKMVCQCLRLHGVAAICRRLARSYYYAHSGFPDLTVWNRHTKRIKFVEVKTDTDKPSTKQIQWMLYLRENGIETEFCYVGVNTTRQRSRVAENTPNRNGAKRKAPKNTPKKGTPKKKTKNTPKKKNANQNSNVPEERSHEVEIKQELSDNDFEDAELRSRVKENINKSAESISKEIRIKKEPLDNEVAYIQSQKNVESVNNSNTPLKIKEETREQNDEVSEQENKGEQKCNGVPKTQQNKQEVHAESIPTNIRLVFEDDEDVFSQNSAFEIGEKYDMNSDNNNINISSSKKSFSFENDSHSIHSEDTMILPSQRQTDSDETLHSLSCDCGETIQLS